MWGDGWRRETAHNRVRLGGRRAQSRQSGLEGEWGRNVTGGVAQIQTIKLPLVTGQVRQVAIGVDPGDEFIARVDSPQRNTPVPFGNQGGSTVGSENRLVDTAGEIIVAAQSFSGCQVPEHHRIVQGSREAEPTIRAEG